MGSLFTRKRQTDEEEGRFEIQYYAGIESESSVMARQQKFIEARIKRWRITWFVWSLLQYPQNSHEIATQRFRDFYLKDIPEYEKQIAEAEVEAKKIRHRVAQIQYLNGRICIEYERLLASATKICAGLSIEKKLFDSLTVTLVELKNETARIVSSINGISLEANQK